MVEKFQHSSFDGVRLSAGSGSQHGQEYEQVHGQANKRGICRYPSLKIGILAIQYLQLRCNDFFMPTDYRVVLL